MTFFRSLLLVCPAACLLAQTPPTPPPAPPQPKIAVPAPVPTEAPPPATVPPDRVVVSVGDAKITSAQFDEIIGALPAQYQAQARGAGRKQFADNLVRILVLSQEGKRRQLDQSQKYKIQSQFQNANLLAGLAFEARTRKAKSRTPT